MKKALRASSEDKRKDDNDNDSSQSEKVVIVVYDSCRRYTERAHCQQLHCKRVRAIELLSCGLAAVALLPYCCLTAVSLLHYGERRELGN